MSRPGPIFPCPTYRVAYVGAGARRAYVDDSDHAYSLALALKIVRQLKARGYTPWVEDEYGRFVPVKGVTRRPKYRDERGNPVGSSVVRVTPVGWFGAPGPREAYLFFGGKRTEIVEVPFEDVGALLQRRLPTNADVELEVRPAEYAKIVSGERIINPGGYRVAYLSGYERQLIQGPFTLPQAEKERRRVNRTGRSAWVETTEGEFVPVKGALRRPTFRTAEQVRAFRAETKWVGRHTCAGRTFTVEKDYSRNAYVAWFPGEDTLPLHGETSKEAYDAACSMLERTAAHGTKRPRKPTKAKAKAKPKKLSEEIDLIAMARKIRSDNPLLPGPPPQYVMGGMGMPEVWRYRGYDIEVSPANGDFMACYLHPEDGRQCATGPDTQSALANARHRLDISEMPEGWWDAEHVVHMTLDHYAESTNTPINRGRIARHIEVLRAVPVSGFPIHRHSYEQFDKLPLPDKLRLIDEVIDYQERAGLWDPKRRTQNPADDPHGTVAELVAW